MVQHRLRPAEIVHPRAAPILNKPQAGEPFAVGTSADQVLCGVCGYVLFEKMSLTELTDLVRVRFQAVARCPGCGQMLDVPATIDPAIAEREDRTGLDLGKLADRLRATRPDLHGVIKRGIDLNTVLIDLQDSSEALEMFLGWMERDRGVTENVSRENVVISRALWSTAVILYTRATKTSSKARGPVNQIVDKAYSLNQKADHLRLTALRDHALCHFGMGTEEDEDATPWVKTTLVIRDTDRREYMFPTVTTTSLGPESRMLGGLLETAIPFVEKLKAEHGEWIDKRLWEEGSKNPDFEPLCKECLFDAVEFFDGDEGLAERFWKGNSGGFRRPVSPKAGD